MHCESVRASEFSHDVIHCLALFSLSYSLWYEWRRLSYVNIFFISARMSLSSLDTSSLCRRSFSLRKTVMVLSGRPFSGLSNFMQCIVYNDVNLTGILKRLKWKSAIKISQWIGLFLVYHKRLIKSEERHSM